MSIFGKPSGGEPEKGAGRLRVLFFTLAALLIHGALSLYFVIRGDASADAFIGLPLRISGAAVCVLAVAAVIVLSALGKDRPCMGIFFFGLSGMLFFVISLGMKFAGGQEAGGVFAMTFDWFTVFVRPLSFLLAPLIGMSEFYRKAILFGLYTAFAGYMASNIKRRRRFYAEMRERREMGEQARGAEELPSAVKDPRSGEENTLPGGEDPRRGEEDPTSGEESRRLGEEDPSAGEERSRPEE